MTPLDHQPYPTEAKHPRSLSNTRAPLAMFKRRLLAKTDSRRVADSNLRGEEVVEIPVERWLIKNLNRPSLGRGTTKYRAHLESRRGWDNKANEPQSQLSE